MGKKMKLVATLAAMVMTTGMFAGCGGDNNTPTATDNAKVTEVSKGEEKAKGKKVVLNVWSHLQVPEVEAINALVADWAEENNVEVKMTRDESGFQEFLQAAQSKKGPDVMFGLAHDNLGTFQKAGLLAEVPTGLIKVEDYASKQLIDAVTIEGKQYGIPIAQETTALLYNKDLCQAPPATMEALVKVGQEKGFKYNINDFYMSYGIIAANGGYVYKNNNGTLDPTDIGLGTEGAVKGYQFLQDLVQKHKLMPADVTTDIAKGEFIGGKIACYISGPWDVAAAKEAGINLGVVPLPTTNGQPTPSFMGVQTAFVSANSENQELAWEFLKYLDENAGKTLFEIGNRMPVRNDIIELDMVQKDEYLKAFIEQAKHADPMPNVPEIAAMWQPVSDNLKLLISGQIDPKTCGDTIVDQIKTGIAQQK